MSISWDNRNPLLLIVESTSQALNIIKERGLCADGFHTESGIEVTKTHFRKRGTLNFLESAEINYSRFVQYNKLASE